ncbi:MAG: hypothetical protein IJK41_05960 [Muribaculaceae bacterium]|nr:hypothetical protein [Muribaculaceae bacterium]
MTKKISFVEGNRAISKNNVKKHIESLKKFGKNLVPMLYVEATEVEGHTLYDAETGEEVAPESYPDYWVVLDGQNRYKAALELAASKDANGFTVDALKWAKVELNGKSFEEHLIEVNTRTQPWKGSDYICGCVLHNPDNEAALFAQSLTNLGISGKTAAKYLFFDEKYKWAEAMRDAELLASADVERAKAIWAVVEKFPLKVQKTSIIIDFIIKNGGEGHWQDELAKVDALSKKQKEALADVKQGDLKATFKRMMGE